MLDKFPLQGLNHNSGRHGMQSVTFLFKRRLHRNSNSRLHYARLLQYIENGAHKYAPLLRFEIPTIPPLLLSI